MLDSWIAFAIALAIAIASAVVLTVVTSLIVRMLARRHAWPRDLVVRARRPFRVLVLVIALWAAVSVALPSEWGEWRGAVDQVFVILVIACAAWLLGALVAFVTDVTLGRYRIDVPDNRVARRIRTQTLILRRLTIVIIAIIALGAILLTFPQVQAFGASVLASAGVVSIIAGLAAQSVLANIFAGLQLAFSDALRVDDVVIAEGEWGRVGEITLSYVVLDLWDDRRLVLPCTYFTTTPFQNWTRRGSELLGSVELDLDWRVPLQPLRAHLDEILAQTELWDGRAKVLQVTEATGGLLQVRVLVTAKDAPTLFDLRCFVREALVTWVRTFAPEALPVQRVEMVQPDPDRDDAPTSDGYHGEGLFTGSEDAEERARAFTQAIPVVRPEDQRVTGEPAAAGRGTVVDPTAHVVSRSPE